ncbi:type II toxin-antitoxin system RatA family toxin [Streptomyces megasporus]|uniref:type II toxin-antitoxin system RatA family toxin n=1 Tax=Streptomyces megasporus TaxID=44060 RepID=UPI0004E227E3|nr:SRPBCC family protein [Streptomyces megasporus]
MTTRVLKATVPATAADVMRHLVDQTAFPSYAEDILSVSDTDDGCQQWVLAFRGGTADWVQRSGRPGGEQPYRIEFEQVRGDFQHLKGAWTSTDLPGGGSEVAFEIGYSTSVPHLAGAIDSAIGHVLLNSAHQVISAVAGPARITAGSHLLGDPSEHLRQS